MFQNQMENRLIVRKKRDSRRSHKKAAAAKHSSNSIQTDNSAAGHNAAPQLFEWDQCVGSAGCQHRGPDNKHRVGQQEVEHGEVCCNASVSRVPRSQPKWDVNEVGCKHKNTPVVTNLKQSAV